MQQTPTDIKLKRNEGLLVVTWPDETVRAYNVRTLRCECGCAGCVDERTGQRILDVNAVPQDVTITSMDLVGNYAIAFTFSDGHDTGIYSWKKLAGLSKTQ